jgi:hypothetical protein
MKLNKNILIFLIEHNNFIVQVYLVGKKRFSWKNCSVSIESCLSKLRFQYCNKFLKIILELELKLYFNFETIQVFTATNFSLKKLKFDIKRFLTIIQRKLISKYFNFSNISKTILF